MSFYPDTTDADNATQDLANIAELKSNILFQFQNTHKSLNDFAPKLSKDLGEYIDDLIDQEFGAYIKTQEAVIDARCQAEAKAYQADVNATWSAGRV